MNLPPPTYSNFSIYTPYISGQNQANQKGPRGPVPPPPQLRILGHFSASSTVPCLPYEKERIQKNKSQGPENGKDVKSSSNLIATLGGKEGPLCLHIGKGIGKLSFNHLCILVSKKIYIAH